MLDRDQQNMLLALARDTIEAALERRTPPRPEALPASLQQQGAAFVSLHRQGHLRGCIGTIIAVSPLAEAVASAALSAALHDPRFEPLAPEELADLELEISVISPMVRVENLPDDIEVGRDGLMVTMGPRRGLLLPQVAVELGWDSLQFLDQTCVKAGLPPSSWRDPRCLVEKFTAEVFS